MTNQVITLGCRLNEYESQLISDNLLKNHKTGYTVVNTCSVTQDAIKKSKKAIIKAAKNNKNHKIIVTGCAAQLLPKEFAELNGVNFVLGNEEKLNISEYLKSSNSVAASETHVQDIMNVEKVDYPHFIPNFVGRTRAFLQVQNGCNHRCTFCTIPFARGNNRSIPISSLVKQIKKFTDNNYKEIVLTGVDITDYGKDLPNKPTLAQTIKRILNLVPNLSRLRLSSIDVAEIDNDLFNLITNETRLMPHMHISLQSGDDMILKRMKRRHNTKQVIDFCKSVKEKRKAIAFGADIIAGFPTETEEMFNNTKNFIDAADLQYLHIFPYSANPNTPAARMPQIERSIIKKRSRILIEQGKKCLQKFLQIHLNCYANILMETSNKGYSENFINTKIINYDKIQHNEILKCKFEKIVNNQIYAKIIN